MTTSRWMLALATAVSLLSLGPVPAHAQQGVFGELEIPRADNVLLPPPPREIRRALGKAQAALAERQYTEMVESLNLILDRPQSEDFFLPPEDATEDVVSIKQQAMQLLGSLPRAGREAYELQTASTAKRLMQEAVERGDVNGLMEVSRRFFHTPTGYQATMLLARYELDQGRPLAAALQLQRLQESPAAVSLFGVELPLQLSICWSLAGNEQMSRRAARAAVDQNALRPEPIMVAGTQRKLPVDEAGMRAFVSELVGSGIGAIKALRPQWNLFRGGPDRNPTTGGGMPLPKIEWHSQATTDPSEEPALLSLYQSTIQAGIAAVPVMQPLAIDQQLMVKSGRFLLGIDLETGLRVWPYPDELFLSAESFDSVPREIQLNEAALEQMRQNDIRQRYWQDAALGQISSDGERIFLLREPDNAEQSAIQLQRNLGNPREIVDEFNRLVALDLAGQGKTLWTVGGPESPAEELREALFLGPPLPLAGQLYVIAEIKDEIKLVVLDAASGGLIWAQQLAQIDSALGFQTDSIRRLAGATPSFAEGILVCPTSSGVVVAVDIASRMLRWGHKYDWNVEERPRRNMRFLYAAAEMPLPGQHWADAVAIVNNGYVLLTPIESDGLICLNLLTGKRVWGPRRRGDAMFIGAVHDQRVLVVEKSRLVGLELDTGQEAWPSIELEEGEFPTGRGFLSDGHYFLPTSRSVILKIRLDDGQVVERQPTERVLGNLICHGDFLISQSAEGIYAYALRDRRRATLPDEIAAAPNDPELLEDYANLLLADGDRQQAIEVLRRAIAHQPDETRRDELVDAFVLTTIDLLSEDFETHQELAREAHKWIRSGPLRAALDEQIAEGLQASGAIQEAFDAYLRLAERGLPSSRNPASDSSAKQQAAVKSSLGRHLRELVRDADEPLRTSLLDRLRERLQLVTIQGTTAELRNWLQIAAEVTDASQGSEQATAIASLRCSLAKRLIDAGQPLEAELILLQVRKQGPPDWAARATALYATCLAEQGKIREAARYFAEIEGSFRDLTTQGEATIGQLQDAFRADHTTATADQTAHRWPAGKIEVTQTRSAPRTSPQQWSQVELLSSSDGWPTEWTIFFDQPHQQIIIADAFFVPQIRIPIAMPVRSTIRAAHARAMGHLLVVSLGTKMIAIDLLRQTDDDAERVMWEFEFTNPDGSLDVSPFGRNQTLRTHTRSTVFAGAVTYFVDQNRKPMGQLGPLSADGICVIHKNDLYCLSPATGEPRWVLADVGQNVLFGDDEYAFVARPSGEARVIRLRDGEELEGRKCPLLSQQWTTIGRFVLYWDGSYMTGADLELRLFDPLAQTDVWRRKLTAKPKGQMIEGKELALLEEDGTFVILDVLSGEPMIQAELLPENYRLHAIFVLKSPDQYLVISDRDDSRRELKLRNASIMVSTPFSAWQVKTPQITGHMYALDARSGKPVWEKPVEIEQYGLCLPLPPEVPVIPFVRNVRVRVTVDEKKQQVNEVGLALLDRRTGKAIFQDAHLPLGATSYSGLQANPERNQVFFTLPNLATFELTFTDAPGEAEEARLEPIEPNG